LPSLLPVKAGHGERRNREETTFIIELLEIFQLRSSPTISVIIYGVYFGFAKTFLSLLAYSHLLFYNPA